VEHREQDAAHRRLYDLSFAKRPADELYDLQKDPYQLVNVANEPAYAKTMQELKSRLFAELKAAEDPRVTGQGPDFDSFDYLGGVPKFPGFRSPAKNKTGK